MLAALLLLFAQWLDYPAKNIPRTKDGKPVLTAKAPRTPDGKLDLSGTWLPDNTPGIHGTNGEPLPKYFINDSFNVYLGLESSHTPDWLVWQHDNLIGSFDSREVDINAGFTWIVTTRSR